MQVNAQPTRKSFADWLDDCNDELRGVFEQDALVEFVVRRRESLAQSPTDDDGLSLMRKHTALMDVVIARLFEMAVAETAAEFGVEPASVGTHIAVAATGGYGRREVCPYSDIDVVFIAKDEEAPIQESLVRKMFHLIMEVFLTGAKMKVGYSYRQPNQCEGLPHEAQTAFLDARFLAGGNKLFDTFSAALRESIDPLGFLRENRKQREAALAKYGQSPHRVEPNIKEGAGGLRDIHSARWAAQVTFEVSSEDAIDELRRRGALTDADAEQLSQALEFLSMTRNLLHLSSGSGNDLLTVERQEVIASWLSLSPDELMRGYYTHAENVTYLSEKALDYCHRQRFSIGSGIYAEAGQLFLESASAIESAGALIQVINRARHYDLGLSRGVRDAIRQAVTLDAPVCDSEAGREFVRLLASQAPSPIDDLLELGVLQWVLPEFGDLMRLLPGDAAHEHTVGEHSAQVVRNLDALRTDEDEEIREISSEVKDRRVLLFAGLLHDVGKIKSNGNHAELGATTAEAAAGLLGMTPEEAARVGFLVRHHLLMGETARLRDLNEPRTTTEFVNVVPDMDLLRMLFLLTLADFRAVGNANWSAVHVRFLRELYHRAARQLSSPPAEGYELDLDRHRRRVRRELTLANLDPAEVDEHSHCMPAAYLLNTSPEDMAMHIDSVRQVRAGTPVIELRDDRLSEFTILSICAFDDPAPGLLSKIAGVLYALDVDIHAAEVFTRECSDVIAIDTLYIDFERSQLPDFKKRQVAGELTNVLTGTTDITGILREKNKSLEKKLDVRDLAIHSHLSDRHTVLEVSVDDCEGLLYYLTKAISSLGWNTHNARVTTFSGRAKDAFYVTDTEGRKLELDAAQKLQAVLG